MILTERCMQNRDMTEEGKDGGDFHRNLTGISSIFFIEKNTGTGKKSRVPNRP
jgi:hypothetical protein